MAPGSNQGAHGAIDSRLLTRSNLGHLSQSPQSTSLSADSSSKRLKNGQFVRFAKSANDWSAYDVIAYNITFSPVAPDEFFQDPGSSRHLLLIRELDLPIQGRLGPKRQQGPARRKKYAILGQPVSKIADLRGASRVLFFPSASAGADISLDHLDPAILTALPGANDDSLSDEVVEYLNYLDFAVRDLQDGDVTQFARETLRLLGFKARNILIPTRYSISYTICGDPILLVFLKEKILSKMPNAEFGVVAGAIAAFQSNNATLTQELSTAVATGQYPATQTRVLKCVTVPGPEHIQRANDGMKNSEYRKLALKRFLAFKTLAKSYWDQMSSGF
ncbi:hypothetical protein BDN72DRAFT_881035 [Pluteus cervinus]|uniref:Uncharacterized protein n=1 Tax=Pluteus cervinus TaxID=181527 RepID=A0ACD3AK93_9AGAR|nr:hypothetical protein BDN72DRAFT_881035 [Pluteus cervinus]